MEVKAGYKQTQVGAIPGDWDDKCLGDVGEALIGLTYKPTDVRKYGTLVLRASNIQNDALAFDDNVFVDCTIPDRIMVRPGDVLICVRNGSRELIGKTAYLDERVQGMTFGAFMAVHRGRLGKLVSYLFQSEILRRQVHEHLGATINQITNKSLNSFRIPVPREEDEQRAIAAALSDVDALLGALDRLIAKKRDLKQASMQQLLTGETRLPGFSGEWGVLPFDAVFRKAATKNFQIQTTEYQQSGAYPVIDQGQSAIVGYSDREDKVFRVPDSGVVVFGDHTCIVKFIGHDFIVGADGTQVLVPKNEQCARFHAYCLMHRGVEATGYNRHFKFLKERLFQAPALPEQTAIAAALSDMDTEIEALEARRAKTRNLKQAMMQELLTGRTRLVAPPQAAPQSAPKEAAHG